MDFCSSIGVPRFRLTFTAPSAIAVKQSDVDGAKALNIEDISPALDTMASTRREQE